MDYTKLPVYEHRQKILDSLYQHQVIVVESPTGSGKTTQLPVILHEAGYAQTGMIGVTQPRRIAAVSVSTFIRKQLADKNPDLIAYKMRFDDTTTKITRIKIMTDGILLQELKLDQYLSHYSVIMVDEAHERSLNIDFVLGLLKRACEMRHDLKVIISSATINSQIFSEYFGACPIVRIETQTFPVATVYAAPAKSEDEAMTTKVGDLVEHIIEEKREGDILIFLPGEKVIKDTIAHLLTRSFRKKIHCIPLYGRLSKEEQDLVFTKPPRGKIKIVVSTNIAETSLTIDGVTSVIDSGQAKINFYNPKTFTSTLLEKPISKASANQRKGRAGRTQPGTVYRLYSKADFDARPLFSQEEIYRTDLSEVVLRMAELGITDFESFDFINSPGKVGIAGAVENLKLLDALNDDNTLSPIGIKMARFPLLPRHSRILVEAIMQYPNVMEEALIVTSFLSTDSPYLLPQGEELEARKAHHFFRDPSGDFLSYLRLYTSYVNSDDLEAFCKRYYLEPQAMAEIKNVKEQLSMIISDMGVPLLNGGSNENLLCAVAKGLIQFVCIRAGKGYHSLTAENIDIHPSSVMWRESPKYIVAGEIVRTSRMYARSIGALKREWLDKISPALSKAWSQTPQKENFKDIKSKGKNQGGFQNPDLAPVREGLSVIIAGKVFALEPYKGKKKLLKLSHSDALELANLPEGQINQAHKELRTCVEYQQHYFLDGEKLSRCLMVQRHLKLPNDIVWATVSQAKLSIWEHFDALTQALPLSLKLTKLRKTGSELGFLTLYTNSDGAFWLKPTQGISTALNETMASLEFLTDNIVPEQNPELAKLVGEQYRRISRFIDEL